MEEELEKERKGKRRKGWNVEKSRKTWMKISERMKIKASKNNRRKKEWLEKERRKKRKKNRLDAVDKRIKKKERMMARIPKRR